MLTASSQRPPHVVMNMARTRRSSSLHRHGVSRGLRRVSRGVQTDVNDRSMCRRVYHSFYVVPVRTGMI